VKCPFCAETVNDAAVVCKTCRRDFAPLKSLMESKQQLESRIDVLEGESGDLKALIAVQERSLAVLERPASVISVALTYVLLPIAVAVLVHFIVVVAFDANLLYLRLATALLPILCGYALVRLWRASWFVIVCLAIIVGIGSVLGMSTTMYVAYGIPVLPHTPFDRGEMAQYMASIALAYLLGALIAAALRPLRLPRRASGDGYLEVVAAFLAHNLPGGRSDRVEERTRRWRNVLRIALSLITAAGMLWTGFRRFLY
jgi:hypothetical protein